MPAILKDGRFWVGFLVGYLICVFLPQLSVKRLTSKASGGGS
jgi:hypothetical protein